MAIKAKLSAVADAIRSKTGKTDLMTLDQMPEEIASIQTGGNDIDDVTFYDYDGTIVYSCSQEDAQNLTELPHPLEHEGLIFQEWNWTLDEIKSSSVGADVGANYDTIDGSIKLIINVKAQKEKSWQITIKQDKGAAAAYVGASVDWGDGAVVTCEDRAEATASHTYSRCGRYTVTIKKGAGMAGINLSASYQVGLFSVNRTAETAIEAAYIGSDCAFIMAYAFCNCSSLRKIALCSTVKISGSYNYNIFQDAKALSCLVIPRASDEAKEGLFMNCVSIRTICIPPTVTAVYRYLAYECAALQRLVIPDTVMRLDGYGHLRGANALQDLRIGTGITTLPSSLMAENGALVCIIIPENIDRIEDQAFYLCGGIAEYHVKAKTPPTLTGTSAIQINTIGTEKTKIYVPVGCADVYKTATNWTAFADYIAEEEDE